ncbi:IscS subfamily cysteine desulfurase [Robertmurraya korlensis]|uniref:IscS subfamily cysteine desulfurase n=1 Tax=Robertmurraya korlensis TaxID=519977 RepID=UPI0008255B50|nr:IscS subfamily cysteine desulfurase [Robertmurraya korlensis]
MKYFDYAATCPLDPEAASAFVKASTEYYGNSQSLHDIGTRASTLLEGCREEIARLLGVKSEGVYFTSGGSESNFLAIQSLLSKSIKKGKHIITNISEHSSIHTSLQMLKGYEITKLPLRKDGIIDVQHFRSALRDDTVLVCMQHVNSEIGTIQPLHEIGMLCREKGILLHSDCVQSFGKLDIKAISPFVDSLAISGHKIYGPKGIGAMYVSPTITFDPYYPNTSHERGMRPGTVNIPAIVSMATAANKQVSNLTRNYEHMKSLREQFLSELMEVKNEIVIHGNDHAQLPSIIGLQIKGLEGQWVMLEANRKGYAISTGSACQVGQTTPSKTMLALGIDGKSAKEFIRISFGIHTSDADVKGLAQAVVAIIQEAPQRDIQTTSMIK